MTEQTHLTTAQLASRWGYAPTTLRAWRSRKRGPAYVRVGGGRGSVVYRIADVEAYEAAHRHDPATEEKTT